MPPALPHSHQLNFPCDCRSAVDVLSIAAGIKIGNVLLICMSMLLCRHTLLTGQDQWYLLCEEDGGAIPTMAIGPAIAVTHTPQMGLKTMLVTLSAR